MKDKKRIKELEEQVSILSLFLVLHIAGSILGLLVKLILLAISL